MQKCNIHAVDLNLIGESNCASCNGIMNSRNRCACVLCGRQYCSRCILSITLSTFSDIRACANCSKHLRRLQDEIDPWCNSSPSSKELYALEQEISLTCTQVFSRLSNFEGLVRFFVENKDRIPRADLVGPLPEIEGSIRSGLVHLNSLLGELQKVTCPPFPQHRDEHVKKSLVKFLTYHITRIKSQFNISSKLYDRLMNTRGFSPASRPATSRTNSPPPIDLDNI